MSAGAAIVRDMSDVPVERPDLPEEPYRPFPSFADFQHAVGSGVDLTTFAAFSVVLDDARSRAGVDDMRAAVDRATRWASVDTGALEGLYDVDRGFTFSVAATNAAWDAMDLQVGEQAARSIRDALEAYEYVLDAATGSHPITEVWIKELHAVICGSQSTYTVQTAVGPQEHELHRGSYKVHRNNPFNLRAGKLHAYAPVSDTPAEMARLTRELGSKDFASASPVVQAAYAHYAFVCVHPFADGNGRVARALAAVFLYRDPGAPLVIFADQKNEYIDALESADAGDPQPFVQFVLERVIDAVRMITDDVRLGRQPSAAEQQERLASALLGRGGLPHSEVDVLAGRALDEWASAVTRSLNEYPAAPPMTVERAVIDGAAARSAGPAGYRRTPDGRQIALDARVQDTVRVGVRRLYRVVVGVGQAPVADFAVVDQNNEIVIDAFLRDISPIASQALRYRFQRAAEAALIDIKEAVIVQAQDALRDAGYSD